MNVAELRGWLLQQPKPAMIRCTTDGESEELKPGKSWAKTAATIAALEPELLQAYDAAGKLLRATRFDAEPTPRKPAAAPELPALLGTDPHAALLHHFATLLHRAYEHSTQVAFEKLTDIVERQGDRADAIEQRLERTEARARRLQDDQIEDAYERAEQLAAEATSGNGNEALGNHLVNAFLSGQLQQRPSNGAAKTNGAPAPSKAKS